MKLTELTERILIRERELAPGSESELWGDYCEDMRKLTGHLPYADDIDGVDVPDDSAAWWLVEYRIEAVK